MNDLYAVCTHTHTHTHTVSLSVLDSALSQHSLRALHLRALRAVLIALSWSESLLGCRPLHALARSEGTFRDPRIAHGARPTGSRASRHPVGSAVLGPAHGSAVLGSRCAVLGSLHRPSRHVSRPFVEAPKGMRLLRHHVVAVWPWPAATPPSGGDAAFRFHGPGRILSSCLCGGGGALPCSGSLLLELHGFVDAKLRGSFVFP